MNYHYVFGAFLLTLDIYLFGWIKGILVYATSVAVGYWFPFLLDIIDDELKKRIYK